MKIPCPTCGGSGDIANAVDISDFVGCPTCRDSGEVEATVDLLTTDAGAIAADVAETTAMRRVQEDLGLSLVAGAEADRRNGLRWEAILYPRKSPGVVLTATNIAGEALPRTAQIAVWPSNSDRADPTWVTNDGQILRLSEMDSSHRANTFRWICRRARTIGGLYAGGMTDPFGGDDGGNLDHAYDQWRDEILDNCLAWLLDTPFMVALAALVSADGNAQTVAEWVEEAEIRSEENAAERADAYDPRYHVTKEHARALGPIVQRAASRIAG